MCCWLLTPPPVTVLEVPSLVSHPLSSITSRDWQPCRAEDKLGALAWLCQEVVGSDNEQTLVFTSTRHHTELVYALLAAQGISCACVYGAMDQVRLNLAMTCCGHLPATCPVQGFFLACAEDPSAGQACHPG